MLSSLLVNLRRPRFLVPLAAAVAGITIWVMSAGATTIPVPNPIVTVTTHSGAVTRVTPVPIGGVPVPIDVDNGTILGLLTPDIDVQVNLISLPELLNGQILVPNIVVRRDPLAILRKLPAPPIDFDARVDIQDAANGLKTFATIHYGFTTPAGGRMPPLIKAALLGPLSGGFVDPLQAKLTTPGFSGPLNVHVSADTASLNAAFNLDFDAMPESIFFSEQPRTDGLDALYQHTAPVNDVQMNAQATIVDPSTGNRQDISANIERLPQSISISDRKDASKTTINYDSSSVLNNPDVRATYRAQNSAGVPSVDAVARIASLPPHLRGEIDTAASGDIDGVDFKAVDAQGKVGTDQIGSIDFAAKNYDGSPSSITPIDLGPSQYVAATTRFVDAQHTIWRASGHVDGVRELAFHRAGAREDAIDAQTNLGDGVKPLRALLDIDGRGTGAPANASRTALDATINPLPQTIHATFDPSDGGADPTKIHYDGSAATNIDASALIAGGSGNGCGQVLVTCLSARVDKMPKTMDVTLPGESATDFALSSDPSVTQHPDVTATVDSTGTTAADRTWANIGLLRVPPQVRGRLDVNSKGVLKAAEFHACAFDFASRSCTDAQNALGRVNFTVRSRPDRDGLPTAPDTVPNHITLITRQPTLNGTTDKRLEATGRIDEVRNVVFHERDDNNDGVADGTLGAQVDVGNPGTPFDVALDSQGRAASPQNPNTDIGLTKSSLLVHTDALATNFSACVRQAQDGVKPPSAGSLSADPLLSDCDRTDVLGHGAGDLDTTPFSVQYHANTAMTVRAQLAATAPDAADVDASTNKPVEHTTKLDTTVHGIPQSVRADFVGGHAADPTANPPLASQKLELGYSARDAQGNPASISSIDLDDLELRRDSDVCGDPRPNRLATCVSAKITDVPADMFGSFDPDVRKGDIRFTSSVPQAGHARPSIDPINLDTVSPGADPLILSAGIDGLTPNLTGRIASRDLDGKPGDELAELAFNACLDSDSNDQCNGTAPFGDGISDIRLNAANSRIGQGIPDPPAAPAGVTDHASVVSRASHFKADLDLRDLRELLVSHLSPDGTKTLASTRVRVGFGPDDPAAKIRAFVDVDGGTGGRQLADAILSDPPKAFTACLRSPLTGDARPDAGSDVFCERQNAQARAVRLGVELPKSGARPDVDLQELVLQNATRTQTFAGKARIDNLGDNVDVLTGHQAVDGASDASKCADGVANLPAPSADDGASVLVEGCDNDGKLSDVAGRITADFQNYLNADQTRIGRPDGANQFPWTPLDGDLDPVDNPDNAVQANGTDPGGVNAVELSKDANGDFSIHASVPHVKRVGISPDPCYTDDRVRPASDFGGTTAAPAYQCVRAVAAPGQPLGLALRTLGSDNKALAVEEGHLKQMPKGDAGLEATIATMPAGTDLDPWCDHDHGPPCRPPLLSLNNDRTDGQTSDDTRLEGRLDVGTLGDLGELRPVAPRDEPSRRLNYEQTPREEGPDGWDPASRGARVKIGSFPDGTTALRIGLDLPMPKFLDLYPPISWSCKSSTNKDAVAPADCNDDDVSSDNNNGFDSSDMRIKLVGADSHHDGADVPFLGRVSVFLHSFASSGNEVILTGAPAPDGKIPTCGLAASGDCLHGTGTSSVSPENVLSLPDGDPSLFGAQLPGHLDVFIQTRNDYHADRDIAPLLDTNQNQQEFTQIDGRTNRPLTMTLRINGAPGEPTETRDGHSVSAVQLTAENLPGTNDQDDFANPSFRVRSEIDPNFHGDTEADRLKHLYNIFGKAKDIGTVIDKLINGKAKIGFSPEVVLPTDPQVNWIDVKLNADPTSQGNVTTGAAARTVDAVSGPFGGANQADIRGWSTVNGSGPDPAGEPDLDKGQSARVTSQATARISNFKIGGGVSASFFGLATLKVTLADNLDIITTLTGDNTERNRLEQFLTALGIRPGHSGQVAVNAAARAKMNLNISAEILFGLFGGSIVDVDVGDLAQAINFQGCPDFFNLKANGFTNHDFDDAVMSIGPVDFSDIDGVGDLGPAVVGEIVGALSVGLAPFQCLIHPFLHPDDAIVTNKNPAPRYANASRPVEGDPGVSNTGTGHDDTGTEPDTNPRPDVTISDDRFACGAIDADHFVVTSTGRLRAGPEGSPNPGFNPQQPVSPSNPAVCDGNLHIGANEIDIQSGGLVTAAGTRTTFFPNGINGGRGGDRDHDGSGAGDGGDTHDPSTVSPTNDEGGPGQASADGKGHGGRGGGVVTLQATGNVTNNGVITVNGAPGGAGSGDHACDSQGGGGGAGGAIEIESLRIKGTGLYSAQGGKGGAGAESGGGGAGGHMTLNSIASRDPGSHTQSNGGPPGDLTGTDPNDDTCNVGGTGGHDGDDNLGRSFSRAAFVTLSADTPGPIQTGDDVKLDVREIQQGGGQSAVVLCRFDADPDVDRGINSPQLNPQSGSDAGGVLGDADACQTIRFAKPDSGTDDDYNTTVTVSPGEGFHGWIALAADLGRPNCVQPGGTLNVAACLIGQPAAEVSTAKIGIDQSPPFITNPQDTIVTNSVGKCDNGAQDCIVGTTAHLRVESHDSMSDVQSVECSVNDGPFLDCGLGKLHDVQLPNQGTNLISVRLTDNLGNSSINQLDPDPNGEAILHLADIVVDTVAPQPVEIFPTFHESAINGWHQTEPTITAVARDHDPSSGFKANAITLFFDNDDIQCGHEQAGENRPLNDDTITSCFQFDGLPQLDGIHEISGRTQDLVGNIGPRGDNLEVKIDTKAPTSSLSLIPAQPDGSAGWYRTKPLLAFSADDFPGGSGVDFANTPSGVREQIDGGAYHYYRSQDTESLADGTHQVCFYAIDVAGNKQSGVEGNAPDGTVSPGPATAPECRANIKVDTVAPVVQDGLSPADPNGANSFYKTRPTIAPSATDSGGSGVDKVQQKIDDGDWVTAAATTIQQGVHEIQTRAFDKAGNVSATTDRVVRVDVSAPTEANASFPPAPNLQGWFRQTPLVSMATADGRDSSGPDGGTFSIDGSTPVSYLVPIAIADGEHDLTLRPRDRAGLLGTNDTRHYRVDQTPPVATPSSTAPSNILLGILGQKSTFNFTVTDALSSKVRVRVTVYDELGNLVRTLVLPGDAAGYRAVGTMSVQWDAKNDNGQGVLPGTYYFRVQAIDLAGNSIMSTESPEFLVLLGILPLASEAPTGDAPGGGTGVALQGGG